jgi:arylformamidase
MYQLQTDSAAGNITKAMQFCSKLVSQPPRLTRADHAKRMRTAAVLVAFTTAFLASGLADARPGDRLRERLQQRGQDRAGGQSNRSPGAERAERLSYGSDPAQRILVFRAGGRNQRPPLAVYIHGGGWSKGSPEMMDSKPTWFAQHGWAFASVGYRMLPGAPVEEQARDIGRALEALRRDAARFGYDPDRILLFGHSAGAHLTALVSSDPTYAGASFAAIRGAILIDGACYDVPAQIAAAPFMAKRTYIPAFGTDPQRQLALSPITHAGGQDAPDWLLLYSGARDDAQAQAEALAKALDGNSVRTTLVAVPTKSRNPLKAHMEINAEFGTRGYAGNAATEAIMRRVSGQ